MRTENLPAQVVQVYKQSPNNTAQRTAEHHADLNARMITAQHCQCNSVTLHGFQIRATLTIDGPVRAVLTLNISTQVHINSLW